MKKQVGLWIDHKRAVIVTLSEAGEQVQEVASNLEKHSRYHGATHPKSPYSAQYQKGDDQIDRQREEQLGKYYTNIISLLRGAQALLILGPGEARQELEKRLAQAHLLPPATLVQPADKMTLPQISARVRRHFKEAQKRPAH